MHAICDPYGDDAEEPLDRSRARRPCWSCSWSGCCSWAAPRRRRAPSKLTLAQMRAQPDGLAGAAGGAARAGGRDPLRRAAGAARAPGGPARDAGGDQQVGVVVRTVPRRVRRLPARRPSRADAKWRSSGSTRATAAAPTRSAFLRSFPVSYPSYYDPGGQAGLAITDSAFTPVTVFYNRARRRVHPPGPVSERGQARTGRHALRAGCLSVAASCGSTR